MSENQNKLYKDIVLEVDIDAKKGAKNQVIETHATFYSYDIQSGLIKINIKKDNKSLPLPNGTQVLLSVVKLDLPQQKMVFTGDIVDSTEGIVHWVIPDELQGYKGTIRTGVFVKLPNDQRLHGGYFKFHMGISEIDENLEPFEENYWQGWHDFQQEAEQEWNAWKASRDKTWKEHEEAYNKWKKQQENKQKRYENDTDECWNNWKNQQEKAQSDFESNFVSWKSAQENKQKQFESDFQSWKDTQVNKQAEFEDSTNEQLKGITEDVNNAEDKVVDLEKNLDVEQKNYFSMTAWENNASTDVVDNDLPAVKLKLEGNTQYTLSTNIPIFDESSDAYSVFFATSDVGRVHSNVNGVAIDKPRTITTNDDGGVVVVIRDKDMISGDRWIMLNKGETSARWIPNADDLATKKYVDESVEGFNETITKQLAQIVQINFAKDCDGVGDGVTNNYQAFINLSNKIRETNGNCKVLFPKGTYNFKPDVAKSWRNLIELVDVKNVYIEGYGATIKQVKDASWTAGYTTTGFQEQESPIQFRGTSLGACDNIIIKGLTVQGDDVPYVLESGGDGNCIGIYFRGCTNIKLEDVQANQWGTDGITIGAGYGNTPQSDSAKLINVTCDGNTRQGLSITGCNNVNIDDSTFKNTFGGSFGHGIDLETNVGSQNNIRITRCNFYNNQRGAFNAIRTSDVTVDNCYIEELNTTGAFRTDGASGKVKNINVKNSTIKTNKSVYYCKGLDVEDIIFEGNTITTTEKPNNNATVRINFSNTDANINNIIFKDNLFYGTGGVLANIGTGKMYFENNKMFVSKQNASDGDVFSFKIEGYGSVKGNLIALGNDVTSVGFFVVRDGEIRNNEFSSHINSVFKLRDDRRSPTATVTIGHNIFSDYFYYDGEHEELHVKTEGTIVENTTFGRVVHGNYRRVASGVNAKVGDVVYHYGASSGNAFMYKCTVEGSPGTWEAILNRV